MITVEELMFVMQMPKERAEKYVKPLISAMNEFEINTKNRVGMFLANLAHESASMSVLVENLNYSAEGLLASALQTSVLLR